MSESMQQTEQTNQTEQIKQTEQPKHVTQSPLATMPVKGLLVKYAVPSIIAMLVSALYNIVDQFFIGQSVGELGNAATNVAFPLSTICTAMALLFGIGGAASFNLTLGKGDKEKAMRYISNAASMLFLCGFILMLVTRMFLKPMLIFFGCPASVLPFAVTYTGVTSLGFPFLIFGIGGGHLIRADGTPKFAMTCNLTGAIINTVLDALFVFVLDMGMFGAALATVLGQFVAASMAFVYMCHFKTDKIRAAYLVPSFRYAGYVAKLGVANFFNQMAMMVVQIVMNNSLTYYGASSNYGDSIPLACAGIISKVGMIFFSVCIGLSQGMQPIASFNYGAKNYKRVKEVYKLALTYGTVISTIAFILFQIFPRQIIGMFGNSDNEMYYAFATRYFRIYMFFIFLNAVQPITSNMFTAIGKPLKGVFLSLTRQILFLLPLIVIFPLFMGIDGIMYAGPIADLVAASVSIFMARRQIRQMDAKTV